MKKLMLGTVMLMPLALAVASPSMGACPTIPGKDIISAYCSTHKKPFIATKGLAAGEYKNPVGDQLPDCSFAKRKILELRKAFQKTDYVGEEERHPQQLLAGKCKYKFHVGAEGSATRGEYNFELEGIRR